jgi:hypothetical protein
VISREHTGYGVFTHIGMPPDTPRIDRDIPLFFIALVCAEELDRGRGLGFAIFIKDGQIQTLEGFAYENKWPDNFGNYKLTYYRSTGNIIETDEQTRHVH